MPSRVKWIVFVLLVSTPAALGAAARAEGASSARPSELFAGPPPAGSAQTAGGDRATDPGATTDPDHGPKSNSKSNSNPNSNLGPVTIGPDLVRSLASAKSGAILVLPISPDVSVPLRLESIEVLSRNARLVVMREIGGTVVEEPLAPPALRLFRARGVDDPSTSSFLAVTPRGVDGWVVVDGTTHVVSSGRSGAGGAPRSTLAFPLSLMPPATSPWTCEPMLAPGTRPPLPGAPDGTAGDLSGLPPCRVATLALDSDYQYFALFGQGGAEAAAAFALTLAAGASEIFAPSTGLQFSVGFLRIWETSADPWTEATKSAQLAQFADHWGQLMTDVDRTCAHLLSGRDLNGGVAYLNAACSTSIGYALSANLDGSFPYPLESDDDNWDLVVVTHELGHNFGAPHTHSMFPPVDGCGLGVCTDADEGTIMSYCHLCPGGMSNIVLAFAPQSAGAITGFLQSLPAQCVPLGGEATAHDDVASTLMGHPVEIDVLANDPAATCSDDTIAWFDTRTAGGAVVSLCIGCGLEGRDALLYVPAETFAGSDSFSYTLGDSGAQEAATVSVEVTPLLAATSPTALRPGIWVAYHAASSPTAIPDLDQSSPFATEVLGNINLQLTSGSFAGSGLVDEVAARFSAYYFAAVDGVYDFTLVSDDGSRLSIDGAAVIDHDGIHPMVGASASIGLQSGWHRLRLDYFEAFGPAGVVLFASAPGQQTSIIPSTALAREGADLDGNGAVGGGDIGLLLGAWGARGSEADLDGDGIVDAADLGLLLAAW